MTTFPPRVGQTSIDYTDGDQLKRFTVTDATVDPASTIMVSIRRPNITDADDPGWIYVANVLSIGSGSFDVLIACLDWNDGYQAVNNNGPSETLSLVYSVQ